MTVLSDNAKILVNRLFGPWQVWNYGVVGSSTNATPNSGYTTSRKEQNSYPFTVPSAVGNGAIVTGCDLQTIGAGPGMVGLFQDVNLGSLAVATNTFTAGSSMPSRSIGGVMVQTASICPVLVVSSAVTATTPTITITYTNQDGTGSRTATLILPTNPGGSTAYLVGPHLQSGDTGILSVEGMSKSAGTAGTLTMRGLLLPSAVAVPGTSSASLAQPSDLPYSPIVHQAGDVLAVYHFYGGNNGNVSTGLTMVTDI